MHTKAASSATFTLPAASSLGSMEDSWEPVDIRVTTVITSLGAALYSLFVTFMCVCSFRLITTLSVTQYYYTHFADEVQ